MLTKIHKGRHVAAEDPDKEVRQLSATLYAMRSRMLDIQLGLSTSAMVVAGTSLAYRVAEITNAQRFTGHPFYGSTGCTLRWRNADVLEARPCPIYLAPLGTAWAQ